MGKELIKIMVERDNLNQGGYIYNKYFHIRFDAALSCNNITHCRTKISK